MLGPSEAKRTLTRSLRKSRMSKAMEMGMMKIMKILENKWLN
jgi:hypothetical protein